MRSHQPLLCLQQPRPALFHHLHAPVNSTLRTAPFVPHHDWDRGIDITVVDLFPETYNVVPKEVADGDLARYGNHGFVVPD